MSRRGLRTPASEESLEVVLKQDPSPPPPPINESFDDDSMLEETDLEQDIIKGIQSFKNNKKGSKGQRKRAVDYRKLSFFIFAILFVIALVTTVAVLKPWSKTSESDTNTDTDRNVPLETNPEGISGNETQANSTETVPSTPEISPSEVLISRLQSLQSYPDFEANVSKLEDTSTPQGQAVQKILQEDTEDFQENELVQMYSLLTTFFSTGGDNWKSKAGWSENGVGICEWDGLSCSERRRNLEETGDIEDIEETFDAVTKFKLNYNDMGGEIPTEICLLTNIVVLDLGYNKIGGSIPTCIGKMKALEDLQLDKNKLTGKIPNRLYNVEGLKQIKLDVNELEGKISGDIGNVVSLESLDLRENNIRGTLPTEIGELKNLEQMDLRDNDFTGNLPTELFSLEKLEELDLSGNKFDGEVSTEIGELTRLEKLYLDDNEFEGQIPSELGELDELTLLRIHDNDFSGAVPDSICALREKNDNMELKADCDGNRPKIVCSCCSSCY